MKFRLYGNYTIAQRQEFIERRDDFALRIGGLKCASKP